MNHCDQCDPATIAAAEEAIRACNPHASMEKTSHAEVEIASLLQVRTWESIDPRLLQTPEQEPHDGHEHDGHEPTGPHTCGVGTLSLRMQAALDLNRLKLWLLFIVKRRSHELMRFKGILHCQNHANAIIVQGVYQWLELRQSQDPAPAESVLVLIGRNLDAAELQREWDNCHARA